MKIFFRLKTQITNFIRMKFRKYLWFLLCLIFCAYNFYWLVIYDRNAVNYLIIEKEDKLYDDQINYLVCIGHSQLNKKNDSEPPHEMTIKELLNRTLNKIDNLMYTNHLIERNQTYLFNYDLCFKTTKEALENKNPFSGLLRHFTARLFIYSDGKHPYVYEHLYFKANSLPAFYLRVSKQKIYNQNYLNDPRCRTVEGEIKVNRFMGCLNECFKGLGIKRSFFEHNDETRINETELFSHRKNSTRKKAKNEAYGIRSYNIFERSNINESFRLCFKKCPNQDCFYETYEAVSLSPENYYENFLANQSRDQVEIRTTDYLANYTMQDFGYQLVGLLTLFLGTSLTNLIFNFSNFLVYKSRKYRWHHHNHYFNLMYRKIRFTLIFQLLVCTFVIYQSLGIYDDYAYRTAYPNKTTILNYTSDPFAFFICLPCELAYGGDEAKDFLKKDTYTQIVNRTNHLLEDQIVESYIVYGNRTITDKFNRKTSKKIYFKNITLPEQGRLSLARCWRMIIFNQELKYKIKLPLNRFFLELKSLNWESYLLEKDQEFTSNLTNFRGFFFVRKNTKLSSKNSKKSNCKDYTNSIDRCNSRKHCIDRCVSREFYKKHRTLTIYSVINENDFDTDDVSLAKFNETRDLEIEVHCANTYRERDCREVQFEESLETTAFFDPDHIMIKLDYENLIEKELEQSFSKVVVETMNLISIFFGFNLKGALSTLISVMRHLFTDKLFKTCKLAILISCLAGFIIHNVFIFKGIIEDQQLVESGYFASIDSYRIPNAIFCLPIQRSEIDENYEITADQLNEMTGHINFKTVFRMINYRNKTHWKSLTTSKLNSTEKALFFVNKDIELSHFFFENLKCFEIELKTDFAEEDFVFASSKSTLEIYLNRSFITRLNKDVYFLYRDNSGTRQLGGGLYYYVANFTNTSYHYSYNIEFRLFQIERDDKFEFLKKPRSLFYENTKNDARLYLDRMKQKFEKKYNLTSRDGLLTKDDLKYKIDDELFEQYYRQVQNKTDHDDQAPANYRQNIYNIFTQQIVRESDKLEDFLFSQSFSKRQVKVTNSTNYTKLFISILNTLSLWLNVYLMDFVLYFKVLASLLNKLNASLIRLRNRLVVQLH